MEIFVGNLPMKTSVLELRKLVGRLGNARYKVIQRTNKLGRSYCYGHVIISNSKQGDAVISRLNGMNYLGSQLYVRPLFDRSEYNERRSWKSYLNNRHGVNRRKADRRIHHH